MRSGYLAYYTRLISKNKKTAKILLTLGEKYNILGRVSIKQIIKGTRGIYE